MIRRPPRSTPLYSSAASDVYKRQVQGNGETHPRDVPLEALQQAVVAPAGGDRQADARRVGLEDDAAVVREVLVEAEIEGDRILEAGVLDEVPDLHEVPDGIVHGVAAGHLAHLAEPIAGLYAELK